MKEHNYTIPLNEAIEAADGCFLCRIEKELEARALEYFTGDAVMEPRVRIETNRKGYCRRHAEEMLRMPKKLPLMLSLSTRAETLIAELKKANKPQKMRKKTCAVCDKIAGETDKCEENCLYLLRTEPDFLQKYKKVGGVCLDHFYRLSSRMSRADSALYKEMFAVMLGELEKTKTDTDAFCRGFDYRSDKAEMRALSEVPGRAVNMLTE